MSYVADGALRLRFLSAAVLDAKQQLVQVASQESSKCQVNMFREFYIRALFLS